MELVLAESLREWFWMSWCFSIGLDGFLRTLGAGLSAYSLLEAAELDEPARDPDRVEIEPAEPHD